MSTATAEKNDLICRIAPECQVREIDEKNRTATFVAATENGVETIFGREYLRMSGVRLQRFRKNPVILDSHDRFQAGSVIGKASVKKEGRELLAEITFAKTQRAEEVWELVRGGFINAVSVGFIPVREKIIRVAEGETDKTGEEPITGPARIVREWELFEISIVPVPADPDAVRRALEAELQLEMEEREMSDKKDKEQGKPEEQRASVTPPAPATTPANVTELAEERQARIAEATARSIRAIAPKGMEDVAERCILDGKSLEEARTALKEAFAEKAKPVGTPEPKAPEGQQREGEGKAPEISDESLVRALCG